MFYGPPHMDGVVRYIGGALKFRLGYFSAEDDLSYSSLY